MAVKMFQISDLWVGNGTIGICPLPQRAADLAAVLEWTPDRVLSLTEAHEMEALGHSDFVTALMWTRLDFPVVDFGVPSEQALPKWNTLEADVLDCLAAKGRVLIHCRGGCGRSGMAALRLMIAAGEAFDPALTRLRAARPCAIETQAQMEWACAG